VIFANTSRSCLSDELKAAHVVWGFWSAFGRPPHLHERRDRNWSIQNREIATDKNSGPKWTGTKNAGAAVAQILNATVELLRRSSRRPGREQAAGMHVKHLWEAFMLASVLIWEMRHNVGIVPEEATFVNSSIGLIGKDKV